MNRTSIVELRSPPAEVKELLGLPNELLLLVGEQLPVPSLYSFLRCNRRLAELLTSHLYRIAVHHLIANKSVLHYCAAKGDERTCRILLHNGANVNATDWAGQTPLHYAVLGRNAKIVSAMLEREDVECNAEDTSLSGGGASPLSMAVRMDLPQVVDMLLAKGADAAKPCVAAEAYFAAKHGDVDIFRSLVAHGMMLDYVDRDCNTMLHAAATYGRVGIVKVLIDNGARPVIRNSNGVIPLYRAAEDGYVGVARLLLDEMSPAEASWKTIDGLTPLHAALKRGHHALAEVLLEAGVDVNVQDRRGQTPLHAAAIVGDRKMAKALVKRGASLSVQNNDMRTPRAEAMHCGNFEVAAVMLAAAAKFV